MKAFSFILLLLVTCRFTSGKTIDKKGTGKLAGKLAKIVVQKASEKLPWWGILLIVLGGILLFICCWVLYEKYKEHKKEKMSAENRDNQKTLEESEPTN